MVGSGAGGRIFLAFDRHLGGRETAIKFYEPDTLIADLAQHVRKGTISRDIYESELSNIYARFRQEAIRISRLDHPAIVQVFDYRDNEYEVETKGRRVLRNKPFLAMEFIKGATLEERLSRDKLPLKDALDIAAQVADGLAFAHYQNLVHRDLKPSNIMIEDAPRGLRVRIIDWGVAKVVAREAELNVTRIISTSEAALGDEIHTRGILLGTPKFIAPEHFGSEGATWSPASDVFALGMLMFRLVTGRPVRRESYVGECLTQSDRELLRRACAHVPELSDVVLTCLSERRDDRHTAEEVCEEIRTLEARLTGTEATPGAPGVFPTPPTRVATPMDAPSAVLAEGSPTGVSVPDEVDDFEIPPKAGPGWLGAVIALVIGVGGGVAAATFLGEQATAPVAVDGAVAGAQATGPSDEQGGETEPAGTEGRTTAATGEGTAGEAARNAADELAQFDAPPDPNSIDIAIQVTAVPPARVSVRTADGYEPLGRTPVVLELNHRFEARELKFEPIEDANTFNPLEQVVYAREFLGADAKTSLDVKLPCANVLDPKCNDYSRKFDEAFKKEAGQ